MTSWYTHRLRSSVRIVLAILLSVLVLDTTIAGEPPPAGKPPLRYAVTDLGIDVSTVEQGPRAINNAGDIVGTMDKNGGRSVAFLWHRGHLTELGSLGGPESQALFINNHGLVAGMAQRADFREVACLWVHGHTQQIVPPGAKDYPFDLCGINDKGQIIGYAVLGTDGASMPYLWTIGQKRKPLFGPEAPLGLLPVAINNKGQVAGNVGSGWGPNGRAAFWDNSAQHDLGTLPGGDSSTARALNDRGEVVGAAATKGIYQDHAFLWDGTTMHDLGTAGGISSEADAINDKGQMVGSADIHNPTWDGAQAILWQDGHTYNLNDLIPADAGWVLEQAVAINDRGQIVGTGHHANDGKSRVGYTRGFLLTPSR